MWNKHRELADLHHLNLPGFLNQALSSSVVNCWIALPVTIKILYCPKIVLINIRNVICLWASLCMQLNCCVGDGPAGHSITTLSKWSLMSSYRVGCTWAAWNVLVRKVISHCCGCCWLTADTVKIHGSPRLNVCAEQGALATIWWLCCLSECENRYTLHVEEAMRHVLLFVVVWSIE